MNIKVDFDNIVVKEDKNDFNVKVLMLKGEKGEAGATSWGAITGTLSNQTDLKNALDGKANQTDFNTVSGQVNTNTSNIGTINGQITDINGELDDFEDLFYGNATVNDEDTSITLDNTVEAGFESFDLKGNTTQDGTPTPSSPIPVNVVSGDNEILVCGKNLLDNTKQPFAGTNTNFQTINTGIRAISTATSTASNTNNSGRFVVCDIQQFIGKKITLSTYAKSSSSNKGFMYLRLCKQNGDVSNDYGTQGSGVTLDGYLSVTYTIPSNIGEYHYVLVSLYSARNTAVTQGDYVDYTNLQLELSDQATNYEPYQGNTYNIDLPSGMELCKIGNYQDYIYKDSDKWYLHKEIGKVVLNGSEVWNTPAEGYQTTLGISNNTKELFCDLFTNVQAYSEFITKSYAIGKIYSSVQNIYIRNADTPTLQDFKTWLSTHNTIVYYVLFAPTNEEITYQPLIDQLNLLEQATSKENQTNISQVNDDLGFIIYAEAFANTFNGRIEGLDYKIDNCELSSNKSTTITSSSTDTEYPSAKAVYDLFNSITDGDEVSY